ncbi:MAG: CvpA family protein [Anaerolineae bacterium]|nr:CvpA family protein [Anaerolineae bacterium]
MLNWIDLIVVLIVVVYLARGWYEGFLRVTLDLVGLALIFWAGWRFYLRLSGWLAGQWRIPEVYGRPLGFLLAGIVAASIFWIIAGLILGALPRQVHHSWLNRLLGLLPAALSGLLVAALVVTLVSVAPTDLPLASAVPSSMLGRPLAEWTTKVEGRLRPVFGDAIAETLNFLTVRPETDAFLELPYRVADPRPALDAEEEMLRLVNEERGRVGIAALVMDDRLRALAQTHSRDMFQRGYFSHYTPDRLSPFDRMDQFGIRYLTAGENLALAPTTQAAMRGLMNSPGHRANILSPSFRRIGIGAMDGGLRGLMFSQEFTN